MVALFRGNISQISILKTIRYLLSNPGPIILFRGGDLVSGILILYGLKGLGIPLRVCSKACILSKGTRICIVNEWESQEM